MNNILRHVFFFLLAGYVSLLFFLYLLSFFRVILSKLVSLCIPGKFYQSLEINVICYWSIIIRKEVKYEYHLIIIFMLLYKDFISSPLLLSPLVLHSIVLFSRSPIKADNFFKREVLLNQHEKEARNT